MASTQQQAIQTPSIQRPTRPGHVARPGRCCLTDYTRHSTAQQSARFSDAYGAAQVFTARRYMRLSVRLSVCHTRVLHRKG